MTMLGQVKGGEYNVENLRKMGYKVRVYHGREVWLQNDGFFCMEPKIMSRREFEQEHKEFDFNECVNNYSGFTLVEIDCPDGTKLRGKFNVPVGKQFNRKLGLKAALGKAFKNRK